MTARYAVCSCNHTTPLDSAAADSLGKALDCRTLSVSHQLCRRDAPRYLESLGMDEGIVVGCTQERTLFGELARERAPESTVRFVNLRESGGWSRDGGAPLPKMAALLAAAALPEPEPVPGVEYRSAGRILVVGPASRVLPWAERLAPHLAVSALLAGRDGEPLPFERTFTVSAGESIVVDGWLGNFTVRWRQTEPIDLDTCVRCDACMQVCPEGAIGLDYRIDPVRCAGHRDCVAACGAVGAIDFARHDTAREGRFDLIFDLSDRPLIARHQPPQGYFGPGGDADRQAVDALRAAQLVGRFDKPKFFAYAERLCAHGRNRITGCRACVDVCSAEAIRSDGDRIAVESHLCVGCGACGTVCPTGALSYAYLRPAELGQRIRTMLAAYKAAGGEKPALLLHDDERGAALIAATGRAARVGKGRGLPARVIPVALHHVASVGLDLWLSAVAFGAANVAILLTGGEAPQYREALRQQRGVAQAILAGFGYRGEHVGLVEAATATELDASLATLAPAEAPAEPAAFHAGATKRNTLDLA
ncbi:MAG: 4Fe-4S dicluster domain-containing protein, partial [Burkholderiaceae bacterium]